MPQLIIKGTMVPSPTSKEVLSVGTRLVGRGADCDAVAVWLSNNDGARLTACDGLSRSGRRRLSGALADSHEVKQTLAKGETTIVLRGAELLKGTGDKADPVPPAVAAAIPMMSRRRHLGALCLATADSGDQAFHDLKTAEALGALISVALENALAYEEARYLADRDPMTDLFNHRVMTERINEELARSKRTGAMFTLVMMDLDNFKLLNDTYGHAIGDRILLEVSRLLASEIRESDILARYGGDEFLALLPGVDAVGAELVVERIQASLAAYAFDVGDGTMVPLMMSCGIASYPHDGRRTAEVLATADANLYVSKSKGGNCVTSPDREEGGSQFAAAGTFNTLEGLVTVVDHKDHYTRRHSDDVCDRALALAGALGLSDETRSSLRIAGLLHDVGKIGVPDKVLRKPGRLSADEFEAVKQHVHLGELIIKEIPNLGEVLGAVSSHHENFDGTGYPRGLKGEEIPLLGRILAVSDAYSAMTTDRPYRKALTQEQAIQELRRVSGTQHDPQVTEAFIRLVDQEQSDGEELEAVG